MASSDPDFEAKAADIIGLYLNPPQHARCFVWTKRRRSRPWIGPSAMVSSTAAMARCRCTPPSYPGAKCSRPPNATPRPFWRTWWQLSPATSHVIADNLTAHKTPQVRRFLDQHPTAHALHAHLLVLAQPSRVVVRQNATSSRVKDLNRKHQDNKAPKTVKWKYHDPRRRLGSKSVGTGH